MVIRRIGGLVEEALTHSIIGGFYEVYTELGFGYLESVYAAALERELRRRGHEVAREYAIRISYKGEEIAWHRLDMVVEGRVVIEVKSSALLPPVTERQLYNYLRGSRIPVGLILHFGWKPFVKRVYADVAPKWHRTLLSSNAPDEPNDSG
jgi:GxxExxY protein